MGTAKFLNNKSHAVPANSTPVTSEHPPVKALAIVQTVASAGTAATVFVPSSGKRFRLHGGWLTPSAADSVTLRGVASAVFQWSTRSAANTTIPLNVPQGGTAAASANAGLVIDAGAGGTIVTGTIFISEEA